MRTLFAIEDLYGMRIDKLDGEVCIRLDKDNGTEYITISEVAEHLEIPVELLIESCFDLMADIHSSPDYLPPDIEAAIDCGIKSDDELKKICKYYDCKYYDLDGFMVEAYRSHIKSS